MDAVGYSESVYHDLVDRLRALGAFDGGTEAAVPISALTGANLLSSASEMPWYRGPSLLDRLEALERLALQEDRPLRVPIQDAYDAPGGRWFVGRVETGVLRTGQDIVFVPMGTAARVTELLVSGKAASEAGPGANAGYRVDRDRPEVARGAVACTPGAVLVARDAVSAEAIFLETPPAEATAECGASAVPCVLEGVEGIEPGEVSSIVIRCERPLVIEPGPTALGRIALKRKGRVVGVAMVSRGAN